MSFITRSLKSFPPLEMDIKYGRQNRHNPISCFKYIKFKVPNVSVPNGPFSTDSFHDQGEHRTQIHQTSGGPQIYAWRIWCQFQKEEKILMIWK